MNTLIYLFYVQSTEANSPKERSEEMADAVIKDMRQIIEQGKDKRPKCDTTDVKSILESKDPNAYRYSI